MQSSESQNKLTNIIIFFVPVGRLCQTEETSAATTAREGCMEESQYFSALTQPCCGSGEPGTLVWTPDNTVPDTVYYQVTSATFCSLSRDIGTQ